MKPMEVYSGKILGAIHGLDRVRFRGTLRWLANQSGIVTFAAKSGILLRDFGRWANAKTQALRASCAQRAEELGIEMRYLERSGVDKEQLARDIARRNGIRSGPVCMFSVVEPCWAPVVQGNKAEKRLELRMRQRKCVWIYHYWQDPAVGFGHVRLQTWLPLNVNVCLNGRHWLANQLDGLGVGYLKDENCFPWIADVPAAQNALDGQLRTDWPALLDRLLRETCPALPAVVKPLDFNYYWSADETEWATDLMFRSASELDRLYPALARHATIIADSPAVMRFFGKRNVTVSGKFTGRPPKEIVSDLRRRHEGLRAKHWINRNSIKMYNKSGNLLRIETTINNTRDFKVYRCPDDDQGRPASWQKLRKGVCDLHRRCEVSNQANERYADALSAMQVQETLREVASSACNPVAKGRRRYRALNPWNAEDHKVLAFLANGKLALNGFRNQHLRAWLCPDVGKKSPEEQKRLSARTTRRIRLLRAHGLIRKMPRVNRYVLTAEGHKFSTALLGASAVSVQQLMEAAA